MCSDCPPKKQDHKLTSVSDLDSSSPPLCIHRSLLENRLYCCLTFWGWLLRGHFMTKQAQLCFGVQQGWRIRQDSWEETPKRGISIRISAQCGHKRPSCHDWRGATQASCFSHVGNLLGEPYKEYMISTLKCITVSEGCIFRILKLKCLWSRCQNLFHIGPSLFHPVQLERLRISIWRPTNAADAPTPYWDTI